MFIVNMIQSIFSIDHNRHHNFVPCLFYLFTSKKKLVLLVVEGNIIRVGLFGIWLKLNIRSRNRSFGRI